MHRFLSSEFLAGLDDSGSRDTEDEPCTRMVVFSGGTAFNSVAYELQQGVTARVAHVMPVSDDGGSTAEIVRVLGGPAVGDIRSRCLRLAESSTAESRAVNRLLGHRLVSSKTAPAGMTKKEDIREAARQEWLAIVEADQDRTGLWSGISAAYKDTIRAFLIHFHVNVLQHATLRFDFTNGSVGNYFFAGARIFFRSMSAAIFLYSRVSGIPPETQVLPAVITEERLTLGAICHDGTHIRGQNNISHPPKQQQGIDNTTSQHHIVDKNSHDNHDSLLSSPIQRIAYLFHDSNQPLNWWHDKQQISPQANPLVLQALATSSCIIYGMGSLYTSILPTLILNGVGPAVASRKCPKLLLLNGWHDRETCWKLPNGRKEAMDAAMFVDAIVNALDTSYTTSSHHGPSSKQKHPVTKDEEQNGQDSLPLVTEYLTHILYPHGGEVEIHRNALHTLCQSRRASSLASSSTSQHEEEEEEVRDICVIGVDSIELEESANSSTNPTRSRRVFDPKALVTILRQLTDSSHADVKR